MPRKAKTRTAHNSTLPPGKPPERKKPPRSRASRKEAPAKRKGSKRKTLESATEKRVKLFYRGLPCVVCKSLGILNTDRTCGHHIVPVSRCRPGRHDPVNIVPCCPSHHTMGNEIAPHSSNPLASAAFDRWLEAKMPRRFAETRRLNERAKKGSPYSILEVEQDYAFWLAVEKNKRDYLFVCETAGVEAWAEGGKI